MKNRRLAITALLLVVALALGIGYASFVDTLSLRGTAKANSKDAGTAFEQDVYFTAAVVKQSGTGTTADVAKVTDGDNDTVSLDALSLASKGDVVTAMYTITNDSEDLGARITLNTFNKGDTTNFACSYYFATDEAATSGTDTIDVAALGTAYLFFSVELLNTPTPVDNGDGTFSATEWISNFDLSLNVVSFE